jgi:TolA-binding protein
MRADIDSLRIDMDIQRERLTAEADRLVALVAETERRMDDLRAFLERTAEVLARTNADFAADFEEWQVEYRRLRGRVDELADALRSTATALTIGEALGRRIDRLERLAGIDPEVDPASVPADADGLWDLALALAAQEEYPRARAHFRLFLSRHPTDERVLRARIEIGAAYAREGRHADAVSVFSELSPADRDGPEGDRVYFHTAQALAGLGRCDDARALLAALDQRYPSSALRPAAAQLRTDMATMSQCPRPAATRPSTRR